MTRVRRYTCGAGALLGVLLLAAFAGTALMLHYEARGLARGEALDRAAGRVFAAWFHATHRASQDQAATFAQTLKNGNAVILTPTWLRALGAAPPGLPDAPGRNATFAFGVISDGTTRGVPMAFGVLEPAPDGGAAHGVAIREGALAAGLAGLESVGSGALMAPHLPAIEAALGRSLGSGALFVTGDHGLRYLEQALYRRAQPGRAYLNRLETGLDMSSADPANPAGRNVVAAGLVTARAAALSGAAEIGGNAVVDDAVTAGAARHGGPLRAGARRRGADRLRRSDCRPCRDRRGVRRLRESRREARRGRLEHGGHTERADALCRHGGGGRR